MNVLEKIIATARKNAKAGKYHPEKYQDTFRVVYVRAYLAAREKMGLLGKMGKGK
jgi:hypothetical protein